MQNIFFILLMGIALAVSVATRVRDAIPGFCKKKVERNFTGLLCGSYLGSQIYCPKTCEKWYKEHNLESVCEDRLSEDDCAALIGSHGHNCGYWNRATAECPDTCFQIWYGYPCEINDFWVMHEWDFPGMPAAYFVYNRNRN